MNTDEKKDVKISIIIPVYNGEATIGACLESALRQTLKEIEIIVYDDCSADSTWEIISEYAEKDSRIIAIRYAENRTASKARKDGVLRARGEYILFLDADDRYADNACAELYRAIQEKGVDILQYGTEIVGNGATEGQIKWFQKFAAPYLGELKGADILQYCFAQDKYGFNLWNKIYRAELCKKAYRCIGDEPIPKAQDLYAYYMIAAFAQSYCGIEEKYYIYNYGGGVTGSKTYTREGFARHCSQAELIYKLIDFSKDNNVAGYEAAILGIVSSLVDDNIGTLLKCRAAGVGFNVYDVFCGYYLNGATTEYFRRECTAHPEDKVLHRIAAQYLLKLYKNLPQFFQKQILHLYLEIFAGAGDIGLQFDAISKENLYYQIFQSAQKCSEHRDKTIPIVFATNNNYAPYLGVALQSLRENSNTEYSYEIFIFFTTLNKNYIYQFERMNGAGFTIRCVNVSSSIQSQQLYNKAHYSVEMYYRFVIADLLYFYPKVLYLDCDIVVLDSVHKLYFTDIGNAVLGAARNPIHKGMYGYLTEKLKFNYKEYFNSGVLLINTGLFERENIKNKCFNFIAANRALACPDQDALNVLCRGKVYLFEPAWNFQWHHTVTVNNAAIMTPLLGDEREEYEAAERDCKILHFTSDKKPWNLPSAKYSEVFWGFARRTAFYEEIIYKNAVGKAEAVMREKLENMRRAEAEMAVTEKSAHADTSEQSQEGKKELKKRSRVGKFFAEWKENGFRSAVRKVRNKLGKLL